jgi:UPF0716 protein FxsA
VLARLALLFTLLPIVEIVVLVWIAGKTSLWFVLGLVIATGLLGAWLVRQQSWQTMRRISADLNNGVMPAESLTDGVLVFLAAVLLIMPGVLSDVLAILLLFPPTRRMFKAFLRRRLQARAAAYRWEHSANSDRERIIDVRVIERPSDRAD